MGNTLKAEAYAVRICSWKSDVPIMTFLRTAVWEQKRAGYTRRSPYTAGITYRSTTWHYITKHLKAYPNPNFNSRVRYVKNIEYFSDVRSLPKFPSRRSRQLNVMNIILIMFRNDVPTWRFRTCITKP